LVTSAGLRFGLKRLAGTVRLLVRNKMSIVGLFLLSAFVFMALAAPLLTPYSPGNQVSGYLAEPSWVMNFPDGYYFSQNMADPSTAAITSPASITAWTLSASPATLANVEESYAPGVFLSSSGSKGSLQLTYSGNGPANVTVSEMFQFPYHGPPWGFYAHFQYQLKGASAASPVGIRLFIQRSQPGQQPSSQTFNLLNENDTSNGEWLPTGENGTLLSPSVSAVTQTLGLTYNCPPACPPAVIFSEHTSYTYGFQVTFNGHQTISVDDLQLQLLGTAWGLLGTDNAGRDVYTQTIYGSRISLLVGLLAAAIGISLGLLVGLLAGFLGKFVDEVLMRFTDMMLVIPVLPLLIVLVAVLGANIWNIIIIIGFLGWMGFARIIRSQVLSIRERPFVEAARASGAGSGRIIIKHVFPNIVSLTYVNLALSVPAAILTESALAFLGLSDPSVVSWGHMFYTINVTGALSRFPPTWWWVLPPGFGIALVSLSFILIGYALDDIFNPRLRKRR
jgi:peptide/nickel transport system permease protein